MGQWCLPGERRSQRRFLPGRRLVSKFLFRGNSRHLGSATFPLPGGGTGWLRRRRNRETRYHRRIAHHEPGFVGYDHVDKNIAGIRPDRRFLDRPVFFSFIFCSGTSTRNTKSCIPIDSTRRSMLFLTVFAAGICLNNIPTSRSWPPYTIVKDDSHLKNFKTKPKI